MSDIIIEFTVKGEKADYSYFKELFEIRTSKKKKEDIAHLILQEMDHIFYRFDEIEFININIQFVCPTEDSA